MTSWLSSRLGRLAAGLCTLAALAGLAACSSSPASTSSAANVGASKSAGAGASGGVVAEAKSIVSAAESGFVGSVSPAEPLQPVKTFNGPKTGTTAPRNVKVVAVSSCVDPCQYAGLWTQKLGAQLGWTYQLLQSTDGSPQSFIQLTNSAIAEKPKVLLMLGVPDTVVQQQIQQAHAAGIKMIGVSTSPTGSLRYDSYITTRQDVTYRLLADEAIAASNGTAHVLWVYPAGFPDNPKNTALAMQIFSRCQQCKVTVKPVQIGDMFSPTAVSSFVTDQLQADPSLNYVIYVDDFTQMGAAQQAANALGRSITFLAGDGGVQGLKFVQSGVLAADPGLPVQWIGYAGYDAVRRALAGAPLPGPNAWGGGSHLWVKSNLPASLRPDAVSDQLNSLVNYRSAYTALWSAAK